MANSTGQARDPRTGRWIVDTSNTPLSSSGRFATQRDLDLAIQGADPSRLAYELTGRDEDDAPRSAAGWAPKVADDLARGYGPVMHRRATLVPPDETASTVYAGHAQGALTRAAARSAGPMDPSGWLTGADDGLTPEARADAIARQQAPAQARRVSDGR